MSKAFWNGALIAQSDESLVVEGNSYFPANSIKKEFFQESKHKTICSWKGEASYFDIVVNGQINKEAAWYYPEPKDAAKNIKGYIAFWKGVKVEN
ncbi:MAG: DUF427 domain-containing protein [Candidatus Melainabacteria bacterium]|jgi:uncharacterized protein (DUF427 family)